MSTFATIGALVLGLVQVAKTTGMSTKYAPLLAVVLGIVFGGLYGGFTIEACINTGLVAALTVMGIYSGAKTTVKG